MNDESKRDSTKTEQRSLNNLPLKRPNTGKNPSDSEGKGGKK